MDEVSNILGESSHVLRTHSFLIDQRHADARVLRGAPGSMTDAHFCRVRFKPEHLSAGGYRAIPPEKLKYLNDTPTPGGFFIRGNPAALDKRLVEGGRLVQLKSLGHVNHPIQYDTTGGHRLKTILAE
jgi:hypothetical protein